MKNLLLVLFLVAATASYAQNNTIISSHIPDISTETCSRCHSCIRKYDEPTKFDYVTDKITDKNGQYYRFLTEQRKQQRNL
jgi:hypothetical protein